MFAHVSYPVKSWLNNSDIRTDIRTCTLVVKSSLDWTIQKFEHELQLFNQVLMGQSDIHTSILVVQSSLD